MKTHSQPASQRGSMLLEALIALLVFSVGILGLAGLQAVAVKQTADAKYRAEAAFLANQIIGQMWAGNPSELDSYAHRTTTGSGKCVFSGGASANAKVTDWLGDTTTLGTVAGNLPGAASEKQQILVSSGQVTVTVCWRGPQEPAFHNYVAVANIRR